jgi:hypothetical protein
VDARFNKFTARATDRTSERGSSTLPKNVVRRFAMEPYFVRMLPRPL